MVVDASIGAIFKITPESVRTGLREEVKIEGNSDQLYIAVTMNESGSILGEGWAIK